MKQIPDELAGRLHWEQPRSNSNAEQVHYPHVVKIDYPLRECEDCERFVEFRCVNAKLNKKPMPHWKKTCSVCQMVQNPQTGKFDMTLQELSTFMREEKARTK